MWPEKRKYFDKWPQQAIWIVRTIVVSIPCEEPGIVKPKDQDTTIRVPENRVIGQLTVRGLLYQGVVFV